jgi:hypothetical protein
MSQVASTEALGLRRDEAAVRSAFSSPWSQGQGEAEAQLLEAKAPVDVRQGHV